MDQELSGAPAAEGPQDLSAPETGANAQAKPETEETPKPDSEAQETQPSTEEPAEAEVSDDDDAEETEGGHKRPSRNQRLKRKLSQFGQEIDRLTAENDQLRLKATGGDNRVTDASDPEPRLEDYQNTIDPAGFHKLAHDAWRFRQADRQSRSERSEREQLERRAAHRRESAELFRERVEQVREHIPDYDRVIQSTRVEIRSDAVMDMIRDSEKGPLLAFHLASKPERIHELNQMSPLEAARYIGGLESRLSLPKPKNATKAPPPVNPPKGGAAPAKDFRSLAESDDITAYAKHRDASRKRA
jgi:hypothetical protein